MLGTVAVGVVQVQVPVVALPAHVIHVEVGLENVQVEVGLAVPGKGHCDRAAAELPGRLHHSDSGLADELDDPLSELLQVAAHAVAFSFILRLTEVSAVLVGVQRSWEIVG